MRKIYLLLISLVIATFITYVSTSVIYYRYPRISSSPHAYDQVRGFPIELERHFAPTTIVYESSQATYPINPYLLTFIFWFSGSLAFLLWFLRLKRKLNIIFISIIALLLMLTDIKTSSQCLDGYPIGFISNCLNVTSPNHPLWFFALLNYSFWLVIALVSTFILLKLYQSAIRPIRLYILPLVLTLLSLIIYHSCGEFLCLFPSGRGFPFSFTSYRALIFLAIDYVFWWIVYKVVLLIMQKLKNLSKQT